MKKLVFSLLVAVMSLQVSVAEALGCGCISCCKPGRIGCDCAFNGLYLGGNMGLLTHVAFRQDFGGLLGRGGTGWTSIASAFTGGGQIGYDHACNGKVFGIVFDFNGSAVKRSWEGRLHNRLGSSAPWFSTLRGRTGIVLCGESLLYLTAGAAVARAEAHWHNDASNINRRFHDTRYGWTAGAGMEFDTNEFWTLGFDILYMQFGEKTKNFGGTGISLGHADQLWTWRFLFNYRFEDLCRCWEW